MSCKNTKIVISFENSQKLFNDMFWMSPVSELCFLFLQFFQEKKDNVLGMYYCQCWAVTYKTISLK